MDPIKFVANSDFGQSGQYVAKLTGRAPRFTFAREFIGRRSGKRNDVTTALVDEPCLVEVCDCTRKGKRHSYSLVLEVEGELLEFGSDESDAMAIAKRLDAGESLDVILAVERDADDSTGKSWAYRICSKAEAKGIARLRTEQESVELLARMLDGHSAASVRRILDGLKEVMLPKRTPATRSAIAADCEGVVAPSEPSGVRHFVLIAGNEFPVDSPLEMEAAEAALIVHGQSDAVIWKCVGESCNAVETNDKMFAR